VILHRLWAMIVYAMVSWHQGKLFIEHAIAIGHDTLHVIVGVLLWLVFGLIMRRPLSSWLPWLWLLAVILWNETVDLWVEQWPNPGQQYGEGAKDLLLTMIVPTVLMFAVRLRPDLFRSAPRRRR
jgi:hypothetical protein